MDIHSEDPAAPAPPEGINERAAAFWRDMVSELEYTPDELEILRQAVQLMTTADRLQEIISAEPLMVETRQHGPVVHRAVTEHRSTISTIEKLLKSIRPPAEPETKSGEEMTASGWARRAALIRHHGSKDGAA